MAHALREFIRDQMTGRTIGQTELVHRSGLSRSHVSKLLADQREVLPQLPKRHTIEALAKAFGISHDVVLGKAIEALGIGYTAADFVYSVTQASNLELLNELARRLTSQDSEDEQFAIMMQAARVTHATDLARRRTGDGTTTTPMQIAGLASETTEILHPDASSASPDDKGVKEPGEVDESG